MFSDRNGSERSRLISLFPSGQVVPVPGVNKALALGWEPATAKLLELGYRFSEWNTVIES